jgi:hypothetical protein
MLSSGSSLLSYAGGVFLKGSIQGSYRESSVPPYRIGWGTRVYACLLEKVALYLVQEITALLELAMIIEITKRVEMRKVNGLVALFAQIGLFPCAIRPLLDATLDHRECNGNCFGWDGFKVVIEENPVVVLVLEPREVDHCLDNGMSIWILWTPAKVEISVNESHPGQ